MSSSMDEHADMPADPCRDGARGCSLRSDRYRQQAGARRFLGARVETASPSKVGDLLGQIFRRKSGPMRAIEPKSFPCKSSTLAQSCAFLSSMAGDACLPMVWRRNGHHIEACD